MARLLDTTYVTYDEEYSPVRSVCENLERALHGLDLDTHNAQYVVRITVDVVDERTKEPPELKEDG